MEVKVKWKIKKSNGKSNGNSKEINLAQCLKYARPPHIVMTSHVTSHSCLNRAYSMGVYSLLHFTKDEVTLSGSEKKVGQTLLRICIEFIYNVSVERGWSCCRCYVY